MYRSLMYILRQGTDYNPKDIQESEEMNKKYDTYKNTS